jgi:heptosyltransferase-2
MRRPARRDAGNRMIEDFTKILALIPNWLGDVAMCTPALRALSRRYPGAELVVAGKRSACDLVDGAPWVSGTVAIESRAGLQGALRAGRSLRPFARDLAVVFPHSFRAAFIARLAGASRRVGYDRGGRSFLLTDRVSPHLENGRITPIYMATEYLDLVKGLGCVDDGAGLELRADVETSRLMARHFSNDGFRVGFAPGAAFGPSKMWPVERFAAVARSLHESMGAQCALLTGGGEEEVRKAFLSLAGIPVLQCDEGRPSIATLKATVSQLDLLVCNDSGARHVAIAFGVPTVCIMGPTSPRYSEGPYERGRVLRVDVDCGPCQKPVCETDHRCMTRISPEFVAETAREILLSRRAGAIS